MIQICHNTPQQFRSKYCFTYGDFSRYLQQINYDVKLKTMISQGRNSQVTTFTIFNFKVLNT